MTKTKWMLIVFLPALIILARLIPHLPNFAPVVAVALVAGAYVGKKWAFILPMAGLLISDLFIGFYDWKLMLTVYGSFALIGFFGWVLRKNKSIINVASASLFASILFFFTTNTAVWVFSTWYTKDWAGLMYCYELALPFFRNALLGDLFYVGALFGAFELVRLLVKERRYAEIKVVSQEEIKLK